MLNDKKIKEFKSWAKDSAKSYVLDNREDKADIKEYFNSCVSCLFGEKGTRLQERFNYSVEDTDEALNFYNTAFWRGYEEWQRKKDSLDKVLLEHKEVFEEAEKIAKNVDVSDIRDGFPCGGGIVYLSSEAQKTELGKTLRVLSKNDSYSAKVCPQWTYRIPIKIPSYGQCVSFDERICKKVADFLTSKNIPCRVYTYID